MKKAPAVFFIFAVSLSAGIFVEGNAQPYSPIQGQALIRLKDGRSFFGEPGWSEGAVTIHRRVNEGEVAYRFHPEEIAEFLLPEKSAEALGLTFAQRGAFQEALIHLESLLPEHLLLAPLLSDDQLWPLLVLANAYFETDRLQEAIELAEGLFPNLGNEGNRRWMERIILLGSYKLGLDQETLRRAREWARRQDRFGHSALGWWLLSEEAMRREEWEDALWISLEAIVFSTALSMEFLDRVYAVASSAAYFSGQEDQGYVLYLEMKERNLTWPEDPFFEESGRLFEKRNAAKHAPADPSEPSFSVDSAERTHPPQDDLDLPLQAVRKLFSLRSPLSLNP